MSKVLILDGNQRSALAATRSLGAKGIPVVVGEDVPQSLAASSKYCSESVVYTSPFTSPESFLADVHHEARKRGVTTILPITEVNLSLILKHRVIFTGIHIPFVTFEQFDQMTNKYLLFKTAQQLNIPVPKTFFIRDRRELSAIYSQLTFPVVLKPYRSRIFSSGNWINAVVTYADSFRQLEETVAKYEYFHQHPFLLQEYIHGQGRGLFALYDRARPVVFFSHRRLREKPPSGGVSVLSESIPLDPQMCDIGRRLLDHAKWHGVAMVEFKVAPNGTPYLMEVNARFWGSLQLAIDAGVDFPWLLYQLAEGHPLNETAPYTIGVRSRWLLGDCLALSMRLANRRTSPFDSDAQPGRFPLDFLHFFQRETRYDVNRWNDLAPFFVELKHYVGRKVGPVSLGNR